MEASFEKGGQMFPQMQGGGIVVIFSAGGHVLWVHEDEGE